MQTVAKDKELLYARESGEQACDSTSCLISFGILYILRATHIVDEFA